MIIFFFLGLIAVWLILFFRSAIVNSISENNKYVNWLQKTKWFHNSYWTGMILLLMNAILFLGTLGILYGLMIFLIPYLHLIVMIVAVVLSVWLWVIFNKAWQGSNKERIIVASIGSSFYFGLTVLFIYMYITIEPYYPGEDIFMRGLGLFLGSFVTAVACITCFVITGFSSKSKQRRKYNSTTEAKNSQ